MSTRACYTFIDAPGSEWRHSPQTFTVYKHHDGYPSWAHKFIANAAKLAWQFPRFEASEFAAAFVAANKERGGGGVYLCNDWRDHGDLEYRYEVISDGRRKEPEVIAYRVSDETSEEFWRGTFSDLAKMTEPESA